MTEPTPIPKRRSATVQPKKKQAEPKPLIFPQPNRNLTVVPPPLEGAELRNFVATCIARTIYKALDIPEAEIITMGESQFEAFCRSILEDAE